MFSSEVCWSNRQGCRKCGNREGASREIVHAHGKLIRCKSSKIKYHAKNCKKNTKRTVRISSLSHGYPIPGLVTQQLPLPDNCGLMQSLVACRVASLAFLKPDFEIQAFFDALVFFWRSKMSVKISKSGFSFFIFFQSERLGSGKTCLSCIFITNLLWREIYGHAGCKKYCKDFIVALKFFDLFNKKQMFDSVFTEKENASKNWNSILSMLLKSLDIYFCLVMHVLCVAYMS